MRTPYYHGYEDRYRRVYAQGVAYWTANPEEVRETTASLDAFLETINSTDPLILECGCGEGHLAVHLCRRGFRYIGIDIAPSAIAKARDRIAGVRVPATPAFHVLDSTRLDGIADASIDIVIDNYHLHMLVTDPDRRRYLAGVHRVLRPGGHAFFRENLGPDAPGPVDTFEDYLSRVHPELVTEGLREAWQDGKAVQIRLPRLPARSNSREGYRDEFGAAGLRMTFFSGAGSACILYAEKPR